MKFSFFKSATAKTGQECTYDLFLEVTESPELLGLCNQIADASDDATRSKLKRQLPVITWQAFFPKNRLIRQAVPSGLFMLDIDHVDDPWKLYSEKMCGDGFKEKCRIVFVGMTASRHGLRVVARTRPEFRTIVECQKWLANEIGIKYDSVCRDFARCSFVVHSSYTFFIDAQSIWQSEADASEIYDIEDSFNLPVDFSSNQDNKSKQPTESSPEVTDQTEGLFGGTDEYKGHKFSDIIKEWFNQHGGNPEQGERNTKLYYLCTRLRYITDFNESTLIRIIPNFGLPMSEIKSLVHSACSSVRQQNIPSDLLSVLDALEKKSLLGGEDSDVIEDDLFKSEFPPFPPCIRQFVEISPDDFKAAVALCQLPILGALGSRLRARYLDGTLHSPSFLVSLEAPQASGKSFMRKLVERELEQMMEHDENERAKEREYDNKVKELKLLNVKVDLKNKDEILGSRPQSIIRYVPPTMSVTKLLLRMQSAQGLHLFALAEEVDTVTKTFKRSFSSYSDLLRVAFDNGLYGQDYASENSFSGLVPIYYNMLSSGTPKAMRRFYPDVEDGLVSRVCFVTLPDQFGKPMPVWKEFNEKQRNIVDVSLIRLNDISMVDGEVQPVHEIKLDWLNDALSKWILKQQQVSLKENDRTRDVFCRRSAVVGFRAGMLAWFLYGEKNTPTIRKNVIAFSIWVTSYMLIQHMLRFDLYSSNSNTVHHRELFDSLPTVFNRDELANRVRKMNISTSPKSIIYRWKLAGVITVLEYVKNSKQNDMSYVFKKLSK